MIRIKGIVKKEDARIVGVVVSIILVYYSVFLFFPIIKGFIGSFHDWNPFLYKFKFKGFANYERILKDPRGVQTFINTFYIAGVRVVAVISLGLLIALGINAQKRFKTFFRVAFFLPYITSIAATSLIWAFMYNPSIGIINEFLTFLGFNAQGFPWLHSIDTAIYAIMITNIWKGTGFAVIIFLAALSGINQNLIDAARIDGANVVQVFFHIKIPQLMPSVFYLLILNTITSLQVFAEPLMMPENAGGPDGATRTIVLAIIEEAFENQRFGYAAALTQILFLMIMLISLLQSAVLKKSWKA